MNKPKGALAVDVFIIKTPSIVSARNNTSLIQVCFTQNVGRNLGLIQGVRLMYLSLIQVTFFFQNNQQPHGIEGEQKSENVHEVILKNSNQQLLNMAENDMKNNTDRGGCSDEANNTLRQPKSSLADIQPQIPVIISAIYAVLAIFQEIV